MASVKYKEIIQDGKIFIQEIHKVVVYKFRISDVEDPELYAAEPIYKWQQTDAGKFIMEHSIETPIFKRHIDHQTFGYQYAIIAELEKKKLSEYLLKWGPIK